MDETNAKFRATWSQWANAAGIPNGWVYGRSALSQARAQAQNRAIREAMRAVKVVTWDELWGRDA